LRCKPDDVKEWQLLKTKKKHLEERTDGRKNYSEDCRADTRWRLKKDLYLPIFFNGYKRDKSLDTRAKKSEGPEEHPLIPY
jgi:hypothetical protein